MVKNLPANAGDTRDRFDSWVRKIPWRRTWLPTPVSLPENPLDGGGRLAKVHGVARSGVAELVTLPLSSVNGDSLITSSFDSCM